MPNTVYNGQYVANERNDYVTFTGLPIVQEAIAAASIGVVTVNHTNMWYIDGRYFEQYNTVATSVVAPAISAVSGLNIGALTAANAKEIEITQGNTVAIKNNFLARTSAPFYVRATFRQPTLANVTELSVGFRKVQTYSATPLTGGGQYTDYAIIGISGTAGHIKTQTAISSSNVVTDTTNVATAAQNFTVQVNVDGAGNVTYLLGDNNGLMIAPTTVVAAQMGAVNMVPWIHCAMAAGANGEADLLSFSCGLL